MPPFGEQGAIKIYYTILYYTSLPITTHHYTSLPITIHHYTSLSIPTKRLPKLSLQLNHYSPTSILQWSRQGTVFSMPLLNPYYFTLHFIIDCMEYDSLTQKLYSHISNNDAIFINLTDHDRILNLLRLDNYNTSQVIAQYAHLMFQKRKQILSQKI